MDHLVCQGTGANDYKPNKLALQADLTGRRYV